MTSSQSPSIVVNIASVRFGRPDSRTMRTASATASETDSPEPSGATEKATSMGRLSPSPRPGATSRASVSVVGCAMPG